MSGSIAHRMRQSNFHMRGSAKALAERVGRLQPVISEPARVVCCQIFQGRARVTRRRRRPARADRRIERFVDAETA